MELKQHLFDTFYHALALETPDAILVTADDRAVCAPLALKRANCASDGLATAASRLIPGCLTASDGVVGKPEALQD